MGCPARKQVERSRTDPTVFIVTYSFEHNHSWPLPRNHHRHHHHGTSVITSSHEPKPDAEPSPSEPVSDPEEKFSELIVEETSLMIPDDFRWPSASSSAAIDDGILYGTLCGGLTTVDDCEKFSSSGSRVAMDEEEDALFAGLGELPECSVVFRRGFLECPMRGGDEAKRCGMEADEPASAATASWCHGTGL
ncbi:hypothetical protein HPP92_022696 [Vanilla planifolia]|uniref:WRKY domain-containing protein n=1 Tax=Vanilla planifolia TaxID=51239 RepID=A0A835PV80_VANPL|nr:hypothetical protein HPP92_022696 [Vanilla planifolia]